MPNKELTDQQKTLAAIAFSGIGVMIMLMAFDIIPLGEADKNAPDWVILACGAIFFIAGIMIKTGDRGRWNDLLAGFLVLAFALVGGWVALLGAGEDFSGGLFLLSDSVNVTLARLMFGTGSLICFAISVYAFRRYFNNKKEDQKAFEK